MCELVEQYAQERVEEEAELRAKEAVRETVKMLFLNGISYEVAQKSVKNLSKEELDIIYAKVQGELKRKSSTRLKRTSEVSETVYREFVVK